MLRDVICVYCNHCTDLDLCRDPALQVSLRQALVMRWSPHGKLMCPETTTRVKAHMGLKMDWQCATFAKLAAGCLPEHRVCAVVFVEPLVRCLQVQAHQWTCKNCSNGYDLAAIEAQLVRAVRLKERAYQLQDLRCTKCRQVCFLLPGTADGA